MIVAGPNSPHPHGRWPVYGYAGVHFGKSLLWVGEDALTLFVMVRFLELPPAWAGLIFLASAFWNALCDGVFGTMLGRLPVLAKSLPLLSLAALLMSGIGFALLPMIPPGDLLLAGALLFLFRTGYSLADVSHAGLTGTLAAQRGHLGAAGIRAIGSATAALVIGVVAYLVLGAGFAAASKAQWLVPAIGIGAMLIMLPLPLLLAQSPSAVSPSPTETDRMAYGWSFWSLCIATAIGLAGMAAIGKAMLHVDFQSPNLGAAVLLILTVGRLAGVWLWWPLARKLGNRNALALSYALSGLLAGPLPYLAGLAGPAPYLLLALGGLSGGGVAFLSWAVLTETLDAHNSDGRQKRYMAGFGYFTMSMKIGLGFSAALVGLWLSRDGNPAGSSGDTLWSLIWIALLCCLVATLMILLARSKEEAKHPLPHNA